MKTVRNISFGPQGPATKRTPISRRKLNRAARARGYRSFDHMVEVQRALAELAQSRTPIVPDSQVPPLVKPLPWHQRITNFFKGIFQ